MTARRPDRCELAPGFEISRIVTGLWQVADMERDGQALDLEPAAAALVAYADQGFDSFDMADHYGSAELIAGRARQVLQARSPDAALAARFFTKWCPHPSECTEQAVRDGIQARADRLAVDQIDLLQLHWWTFEHPGYLEVMAGIARAQQDGRIARIGLTNVNADHVHLLAEEGFAIATNQVCVSPLDRRALGEMTQVCAAHGVKLLAYGTLAGGFLSDKWLDRPEPDAPADWSKMKYRRFIDAAGGWSVFQDILQAFKTVADRHGVSIANVVSRWVLDQPAVAAVIIGARLGEREHMAANLVPFTFTLSEADLAVLDQALARTTPIAGDCGDEYRKPPFLTASGDLSDHLDTLPQVYQATPVPGRPGRTRIDTGSAYESLCGYSRAMRIGERILVSGTTATHGAERVVCPGDVRGQAIFILDKIAASLRALGGSLDDVVRTRIYLKDARQWEPVSRVHGRYFAEVRPANTLVEIADLVGDYDVEIEAEAIVDGSPGP